MTTASEQTVEARQRLLVAAGAALLGAGIILVAFVLPAEYAVDPLGTGARTGLLDLGLVGQQVEASVLALGHDKRRLSLSLGAKEDASPEDVAAAPRAPQKLGTLGDLLQRKK